MLAKQVMVVESKLSPDGIRNLEASGSPGRCKSRLEVVEPWTVKLSPQLIEIWKFVEERAVVSQMPRNPRSNLYEVARTSEDKIQILKNHFELHQGEIWEVWYKWERVHSPMPEDWKSPWYNEHYHKSPYKDNANIFIGQDDTPRKLDPSRLGLFLDAPLSSAALSPPVHGQAHHEVAVVQRTSASARNLPRLDPPNPTQIPVASLNRILLLVCLRLGASSCLYPGSKHRTIIG